MDTLLHTIDTRTLPCLEEEQQKLPIATGGLQEGAAGCRILTERIKAHVISMHALNAVLQRCR